VERKYPKCIKLETMNGIKYEINQQYGDLPASERI
jgi:hypothetical protein